MVFRHNIVFQVFKININQVLFCIAHENVENKQFSKSYLSKNSLFTLSVAAKVFQDSFLLLPVPVRGRHPPAVGRNLVGVLEAGLVPGLRYEVLAEFHSAERTKNHFGIKIFVN